MKVQEGPAFGAMIIGGGLGYLISEKTGNIPLATLAGLAIGVVDYFAVIWIADFMKKRKK